MKILVGNLENFESGTIIGVENQPIDFVFDAPTEFIVRFVFSNDPSESGFKVNVKPYLAKGAQLDFINYNNSLGIGNLEPFKFGHLNGRELYLSYRIYSFEKGGKLVHYSWLLGNKIANG